MKREYKFKYDEEYLSLALNPDQIIQELQAKDIQPLEDVVKEVNRVLDAPLASPPFNTLFQAGDQVTIVVSDITRLVKLHEYLPTIVNRLNSLGIPDKDILILTATGTHRGQTADEKKKVVGAEMYGRLEVIDHDCDLSEMVYVGTTPRGTEVVVNRLVVERKVILTGGIVHHLMAGFGGGRKSILPGVASRETIAQNHLHSLDPHAEQSNPLIGVGALIDNPLHEDMVDATQFVNPNFLLNAVIHTDGRIAKLFAGHWLKAWEEGCVWADENYGVPIEKKADLVIASCGGFPKDISLYQSTKTLFNASLAVKPGGKILVLAGCREGAGADEFFGWSEPLKEQKLDPELRKNFTIPGYIFYAAVESARKANVILYSMIEPELVKPMGMTGVNSLAEALELAQVDKENQDIIIMPYGGATIPLYQKG
ncbi:MAG: nickel-dependent lactate racemase [Desulfitobacterium sp.]